ncbi:WD domain-containing [Fusarium albosuccineum]|uniref:Mitochondrial division protein 1 n=1 Tax=Fusarium albosuccineum TaxID=1237068 RepID=A0A8H4NWJ1_9HYPO|nr:WD domain-containing [Fusarium albosuccineum]
MRRIKALVRKGKQSLRDSNSPESTGSSSDTHLADQADVSVTARADCSPATGCLNQHEAPQDDNGATESFSLPNIWAEAYKKVQENQEHSKLLANLESYLSRGQSTTQDATGENLTGVSSAAVDEGIDRLKLIQRTAEEKLEKLPEAQLAFKIRDKQIVVRQAIVKAIQVITAFKPIISGAVSAEPHAALAWAGVMTVLPILENVFQQDQDAADGLNNIVFVMARYQQLQEASFASEFHHSSHTEITRQLLSRIRTELVSIYAQIYVYETRFVLQYATRNKAHRSLRNTVNADDWKRLWADIESTSRRIDQGVQDRVGARTLEMWQQVNDIMKSTERIETLQNDILDAVRDVDQRQLLLSLKVTGNAIFDSGKTSGVEVPCLPGTQRRILKEIQDWTENPTGETILWLQGMAGTGKTSVALTVANALNERQPFTDGAESPTTAFLGASFFFKQGDATRNSTSELFPTLAWCLASVLPDLKLHIADAIVNNLGIETKGPQQQLKELILGPLSLLDEKTFVPLRLVVVVDALDECDENEAENLLGMLANIKHLQQVQLRILITSRREGHLLRGFKELPGELYRSVRLDKIELPTDENEQIDDITLYLSHTLAGIAKKNDVEEDWITDAEIKKLREKANGLFIYAATTCRFLDSRDFDDKDARDQRLELIFEDEWETVGPQQTVDGIYIKVLKFSDMGTSHKSLRDKLYLDIGRLLGFIAVFFEPASVATLRHFLPLMRDKLSGRLRRLHSIVSVPENETSPIALVHLSFRDFILSEKRSKQLPFRVEEASMHREVFERCLELMFLELRQDICDLVLPGKFVSEVLPSQIEQCIPQYLRYACRYWVDHLAKLDHGRRTEVGLEDGGRVHVFLQEKFLYWLEVMAFIKEASSVILIINQLQTLINPSEHSDLSSLVYDVKRFVLSNRWIIENAPLQIYCSALLFCPKGSLMRSHFQHLIPDWVLQQPKTQEDWNSELGALQGHAKGVIAVAMSPTENLVASISDDGTTRVWDYITGSERFRFQDSERTHSVSFSADGRKVASGLHGGSIRVRDLAKGNEIELNSDPSLLVIAFSPTVSSTLASASFYGKLRIWNVDGEREVSVRDIDGEYIQPVLAFSHDGRFVATVSGNTLVTLWSVEQAEPERTFDVHKPVWTVVFSPDGKTVIVGSSEGTSHWDIASLERRSFEMDLYHYGVSVQSIAVCPTDGKKVAYGLSRGVIDLLDTGTGYLIGRLFTQCKVSSISWSHDGTLLAVADWDHSTIQLWDTVSADDTVLPEPVAYAPHSVQFLPDASMVVSLSPAGAQLWKVANGGVHTLLGPLAEPVENDLVPNFKFQLWDKAMKNKQATFEDMTDVLFLPSNDRMAMLSTHGDIKILDNSGDSSVFQEVLSLHVDDISALYLSPNAQLAVLKHRSSRDLQLWDLAKKKKLASITDPRKCYEIGFSPDSEFLCIWERQRRSLEADNIKLLFHVPTGKEIGPLQRGLSPTFHPADQLIALIRGSTIVISETATQKSKFVLNGIWRFRP